MVDGEWVTGVFKRNQEYQVSVFASQITWSLSAKTIKDDSLL